MSEVTWLMAESALRTGVLMGLAAGWLAIWRGGREAAVRSAVWNAVLVASLLMPLAVRFLPPVFLREPVAATLEPVVLKLPLIEATGEIAPLARVTDWVSLLYLAGVAVGLLRVGAGLIWGWRLRRQSEAVRDLAQVDVVESAAITVPMTFGWWRPFVVLPAPAWRKWEPRKLDAVLLHESAHVERGDFFMQLLAALHRVIYWFSPLAWWLPRHLSALAEQASDDRVLLAMQDRTYYAEVLFSFLNQPRVAALAVPMARSGAAMDGRIDRVLEEGRPLSAEASRPFLAAVALVAGIALYGAASASFAQAPPSPPPPPPPAMRGVPPAPPAVPARGVTPAPPAPPAPPVADGEDRQRTVWRYRNGDTSTRIDLNGSRLEYETNGQTYRITDAATLAEVKRLYQPMEALGKQQAELGHAQGKLGKLQAELGARQSLVSVDSSELRQKLASRMDAIRAKSARKTMTQNELGELQEELSRMQGELSELQARAGGAQARLGQEQANLGEEQAQLGGRQAELGKRQAEASADADRELKKLLERALKDGLAKRVD